MILWGAIVGALIGWVAAGFEGFGLMLGVLPGLIAGWGLRSVVRQEVAAATAGLRDELEALRAGRAAEPRPVIAAHEPVAPATSVRLTRSAAPVEAPLHVGSEVDALPPGRKADPSDRLSDLTSGAFDAAKAWLLGGNTIVRIGLVILFVGLSFLARYAASAGLFPIELRLALVVAAGAALLAVGFRTRARRPGFALALQGTGVATIYLTIFAAARLFGLLPILPAFGLMIVVCAFGCALALRQNAQSLAVAAFAGGFAVPLLLGGKDGSTIGLFGYFTVLNLAVLFIAGRRSWRAINLVGFFATFGMATLWGFASYVAAEYAVAQVFLALSVLIYLAAAILYARNTPGRLGHVVDSTLLFGPAIAGFGLQVGLVRHEPFGSAYSALGFGALYLILGAATLRRRGDFRVLAESMVALGVGFATLAVPLAFGAGWTSAAWALEGAGAFWVGMRQRRWLPRVFGLALQAVAALVFLADFDGNLSAVPFANAGSAGAMLIAVAALATAWWLRRPPPDDGSRLGAVYARFEAGLPRPVFLFGFAAWVAAWAIEAARSVPAAVIGATAVIGVTGVPVLSAHLQLLATMLAFVASAWIWAAIGRARDWEVATWPSRVTLVALALAFIGSVAGGHHVLHSPDWAIWAAVIVLHLWLLFLNERRSGEADRARWLGATHVGGVLLGTAMLADCLWLGVDVGGLWNTSWAGVVFLVGATAVLLGLVLAGKGGQRWPLDRHTVAYSWTAAVPIAGLVFAGSLATALFASGRTDPLPYVPLLNPVDLAVGLALATLVLWRRVVATAVSPGSGAVRGPRAVAALAGLGFVMLNSVWLRLAHHMLGVAWDTSALQGSFVVQTGLAILWTLLALGVMTLANRRGLRAVWLAGAGLLGLVVLKLLLIDLTNAGGAERIVTFIAVGALMLVVGYLAPLPPRAAAT